ncbi:hypothetical protein ACTID9_24730 [Brevibacillus fluminis]
MPLWVFMIIAFGGLFGIGYMLDIITKRRKTAYDIQTSSKNLSPFNRVYTETLLNEIGKDMQHNGHN